MGSEIEGNLLTVITFMPLAVGLVLIGLEVLARGAARHTPDAAWRAVGFAGSGLTFLLSLDLLRLFDPARPGMQLVRHVPWLPEWGISYYVGVDGISLLLILLTTFTVPLALLASWNDVTRSIKSWIFFMLFLETGMLGAFVSLNLFPFYLFWEIMLIPMYFIIGIWGGPRRIYAAVKFFLFTMFGSLLMLVAILVVYRLHFEQFGVLTLDLVTPPGRVGPALLDTAVPVAGVWWSTQTWLFAAFALAFAVKVPLVPLHTWLPDAHVEAPTAGSVILAGVLLKMGTYGFLRFAVPLFPEAAIEAVPLLSWLAIAGILYGSLVAMVQSDVKKLVAYSSVAHLGFVMLGMFAFNREGLSGSILQMVNHGLSTGALFLLVGMIYERRHTREIAQLGGIAKAMPVYAAFFGVVTMSSIGLPMLNGFVGEFLILLGTFGANPLYGVLATFGVILAAAYMLWMYRRVFFGPVDNPANRGLIDLSLRERAVLLAVVIPIVWIGVYPDPFLRRLDAAVGEVLRVLPAEEAPATGPAADEMEPRAPARPEDTAQVAAGGADAAEEGAP